MYFFGPFAGPVGLAGRFNDSAHAHDSFFGRRLAGVVDLRGLEHPHALLDSNSGDSTFPLAPLGLAALLSYFRSGTKTLGILEPFFIDQDYRQIADPDVVNRGHGVTLFRRGAADQPSNLHGGGLPHG